MDMARYMFSSQSKNKGFLCHELGNLLFSFLVYKISAFPKIGTPRNSQKIHMEFH